MPLPSKLERGSLRHCFAIQWSRSVSLTSTLSFKLAVPQRRAGSYSWVRYDIQQSAHQGTGVLLLTNIVTKVCDHLGSYSELRPMVFLLTCSFCRVGLRSKFDDLQSSPWFLEVNAMKIDTKFMIFNGPVLRHSAVRNWRNSRIDWPCMVSNIWLYQAYCLLPPYIRRCLGLGLCKRKNGLKFG